LLKSVPVSNVLRRRAQAKLQDRVTTDGKKARVATLCAAASVPVLQQSRGASRERILLPTQGTQQAR